MERQAKNAASFAEMVLKERKDDTKNAKSNKKDSVEDSPDVPKASKNSPTKESTGLRQRGSKKAD